MSNWISLDETTLRLASSQAHGLALSISESSPTGLVEAVSSEVEVIVRYHPDQTTADRMIQDLSGINPKTKSAEGKVVEIPVCYELGLDWEEVTRITGLSQAEVTKRHGEGFYTASYGFMPGFLYLSGLDQSLHCVRKSTPRTRIPAGAVAIGGSKTGIYALESPGGWQVIGRTPLRLFDITQPNPIMVPNGGQIRFVPITREQFEDYAGD